MDRLIKQMEFALLMDKQKAVGRQTYILDALRKENDAEHGWHLAVMTMLLAEYANEPIDVSRTVSMVIMHDVIEIYAGDTYAYDTVANESKRERELEAADKIFSILPDDQKEYFRGLWDEFEEKVTPEAKFANTMDSVQPLMLNDASGGLAWREHGVYAKQVRERAEKKIRPGSEKMYQWALEIVDKNVKLGNLKEEI
jgi:putative hydrolase of HD superfamily